MAQSFPTKPIAMIVPFAAGGPTDIIARITAESFSKTLGQQVIVENVAGTGSSSPGQAVRRSRATSAYFALMTRP